MKIGDSVAFTIPVTNTSTVDGYETVQLYVKKVNDIQGPIHNLRSLKKVFIKSGETVLVKFTMGDKELEWWSDEQADMTVQKGDYQIEIGKSSRKQDFKSIM